MGVWRGGGGAEGMAATHSTYRIRRAASAPKATFWLLQCEHQYAPYLRGVARCSRKKAARAKW